MSYTVILKRDAEKEFSLLPKNYYKLVKRHLLELNEEPHPYGSIKLKGSENTFRLRVGVYRIIYEIHNNELIICIISISHRKDAYR